MNTAHLPTLEMLKLVSILELLKGKASCKLCAHRGNMSTSEIERLNKNRRPDNKLKNPGYCLFDSPAQDEKAIWPITDETRRCGEFLHKDALKLAMAAKDSPGINQP